MKRKKITIFLIGAFIILYDKFYLRHYVHLPAQFNLAKDVAPNLISAFIFPFCADLFFKRWVQLTHKKVVFQVCLAGLIFMIGNELAQLFPIFKRTFDLYDILFSFIGISFGYLVYTKWFIVDIATKVSYYDPQ